MADLTIPRCSFIMAAGLFEKVSEPYEVRTVQQSIPPEIHPIHTEILHSIAKDYIFHYVQKEGEDSSDLIARLTISIENGVEFEQCSHQAFQEIEMKAFKAPAVLPKSDTVDRNVQRVELTEEQQLVVKQRLQDGSLDDFEVVNQISLALSHAGATHPTTVDLEVRPFFTFNQGKGLTTGNLRFPHILLEIHQRLLEGKYPESPHVCIVGPGMYEYEEKITATCPQFIELLSLFPEGRFTLLDNDPHLIDSLGSIFSRRIASYDPVMFRAYTMEGLPEFIEDPRYQDLFSRMKGNLLTKAIAPRNKAAVLDGQDQIQALTLMLNPGQVEVREFDILTSDFKAGEQFDIIVATMSIINAFTFDLDHKPFSNHFERFAKFLLALNVNGSLYIDATMIDALKERWRPEGFALGIRYLETLLGNELEINEISLPNITQGRETISNISTFKPQGLEHRLDMRITTANIYILKRSERVVDQEAHEEAKREFEGYLEALSERASPKKQVGGDQREE